MSKSVDLSFARGVSFVVVVVGGGGVVVVVVVGGGGGGVCWKSWIVRRCSRSGKTSGFVRTAGARSFRSTTRSFWKALKRRGRRR